MKKIICLLCSCTLLAGCADVKKSAPTEGRIAVRSTVNTDIEKATNSVKLGVTDSRLNWAQNNANAKNLMPHGHIKPNASLKWNRSVGKGISNTYLHLPSPIIQNGVIYALDASFKMSAVQETDGKIIWQKQLPVSKDMGLASIGLTSDSQRIYAVSGDGVVYALDTAGNIKWQKNTNAILRSSPTLADGILYLLSGNNELFAINGTTGEEVWTYRNMDTSTNLFGMGQPAVSKGVVVVPFSNGEIIAFDAKTGMMLWSDILLSSRRFNQIEEISHVLASPVIDGDTVYLVGNAQKTGAFDLKTGEIKFMQNIGGQNTPVINGNALFMITKRNTLTALDKETGLLIWETPLETKEPKNVYWSGPVLANGRLIVVSNKGDIYLFDAVSGQIKEQLKEESIRNKPILGNERVIIYTDDADLLSYE